MEPNRPGPRMGLTFRDSRDGRLRPLAIPTDRPVAMYVCGPTVYDAAHVGHGRTYLYFDLLRRVLLDRGIPVRVVRNLTDYEDKVTWRAEQLGVGWRPRARREERLVRDDMDRLGLRRVDWEPRASEFVPQMIRAGRRLERTGRVEHRGDTWVYCPPAPSGRNFAVGDDFAAHMVPEPGHDPAPEGERAREIVVWKNQHSPYANWSSPWGSGAPGWHLECYAMAERYLGIPVDLHGGGMDLIFPHHYAENEIALALDDALFSRRFLHPGFVTQLHRKMAKSRGNLVSLREAMERLGADGVRWYVLGSAPYHRRLEWQPAEADRAAEEWREVRSRLRAAVAPGAGGSLAVKQLEGLADRVRDRIEEGFAVEGAIAEVRSYAAEVGAAGWAHLARGEAVRGRRAIRRIDRLLGCSIAGPARLGSA